MTTKKQAAANKANAQKSTGPKTSAGKAVVAGNAISHGLLSRRLFLEGENPAEFDALQDDLRLALRPMGALELALVEKVGIALWKQKRLVAAESATIELGRSMRRDSNRDAIKCAMGLGFTDDDVTDAELEQMSDEDRERLGWCIKVMDEFAALDDVVLDTSNLEGLAKDAALMFQQLKEEAEDEAQTLPEYLKAYEHGLAEWALGLSRWCKEEIKKLARRPLVQSIAKLVQAEKSAPVANEVLMRYQVSLDGELYRAMEALRKQQAFRLKLGIEVEGEVVS